MEELAFWLLYLTIGSAFSSVIARKFAEKNGRPPTYPVGSFLVGVIFWPFWLLLLFFVTLFNTLFRDP
jgi:hypothetical protein